jgi:hypothetical protein
MNTISTIENALKNTGFAKYKASIILESNVLDGWFMDKANTTFVDNLSELIYDLNDLQINIDYDLQIQKTVLLKGVFEGYLNKIS